MDGYYFNQLDRDLAEKRHRRQLESAEQEQLAALDEMSSTVARVANLLQSAAIAEERRRRLRELLFQLLSREPLYIAETNKTLTQLYGGCSDIDSLVSVRDHLVTFRDAVSMLETQQFEAFDEKAHVLRLHGLCVNLCQAFNSAVNASYIKNCAIAKLSEAIQPIIRFSEHQLNDFRADARRLSQLTRASANVKRPMRRKERATQAAAIAFIAMLAVVLSWTLLTGALSLLLTLGSLIVMVLAANGAWHEASLIRSGNESESVEYRRWRHENSQKSAEANKIVAKWQHCCAISNCRQVEELIGHVIFVNGQMMLRPDAVESASQLLRRDLLVEINTEYA